MSQSRSQSQNRSRDTSKIINESKLSNKKKSSEMFKTHNDTYNEDQFETSTKIPDAADHSNLEVTESPQRNKTFDNHKIKQMNEPIVQRDKLETLDTNRDQPIVEQNQ